MNDPAVLFYTKDFLTGTSFFSDAERGQYIRLLCEQHQNGHIPENHMLSICFSLGSPVVKKFVKDAEGYYYNERMEKEIIKRKQFTDSRRVNALKGGRPKKNIKPNEYTNDKPLGFAKKNLIGNGNGNINEYKMVFENFRKIFPGSKRGLETEFDNFRKKYKNWIEILPLLQPAIEKQIKIHDAKLKANQFTPEYPMLSTWINQRRWEVESTKESTIITLEPIPPSHRPFKNG